MLKIASVITKERELRHSCSLQAQAEITRHNSGYFVTVKRFVQSHRGYCYTAVFKSCLVFPKWSIVSSARFQDSFSLTGDYFVWWYGKCNNFKVLFLWQFSRVSEFALIIQIWQDRSDKCLAVLLSFCIILMLHDCLVLFRDISIELSLLSYKLSVYKVHVDNMASAHMVTLDYNQLKGLIYHVLLWSLN